MSRTIMLIPIGINVGLTSVAFGLIRAIERKGIRLNVFRIIIQSHASSNTSDQITNILQFKNSNLITIKQLKISDVEFLLSKNKKDILMEEIISNYYANTQNAELVLVEGLSITCKQHLAYSLNFEIAKTLNAEIILVISQDADTLERLKERVRITSINLDIIKKDNIAGIIINKLNAPANEQWYARYNFSETFSNSPKLEVMKIDQVKLQISSLLPVLGVIPWNFDLIATRAIDIARHLNATIINKGDIDTRRVMSLIFCTRSITYMMKQLNANSLLIISADRTDLLVASCLAAINGMKISAILLIDGHEIDVCIIKLCERAFITGLPVFMVNTNALQTSIDLHNFNLKLPVYDQERIEKIREHIANYINANWIESLTTSFNYSHHLSPPAFRYKLTEMARKLGKRIVLPEGSEPRILQAATICAKRDIATCILLGDPDIINKTAISHGINLDNNIEIINPEMIRENYVAHLVKLRKNKGMNKTIARKQLEENTVLGTLMLAQNEVDGLVSGAVHTTADTIRPSLQLIKTAPGNSLISSVFFMLLPEQVYVYGDCAINLDPTAEQLAEIAIQSADSAIAFGIEPRVAMLSYSTGTSGTGKNVEKVREATRIAQEKRPNLIIDGPLQYDAAVEPEVAKSKAPNSLVAGRATVFIFPDLNTGNIAYKAVQRSADLISIGPMLQGMRKPVNDLSRGALVEDIVYTIALTAIQSSQE